jgi:hypothetical protein
MKYSELKLKRMNKAVMNSTEDKIKYNILNFIHTIHLNELNFIQESFDTEFFGELVMTF